jgi:Molecular chaperone, HSP90 family
MGNKKEEKAFQSDVKQVLDLVINSLYSNREIFLRELISNAADATDKLRFLALSNEDLYEGQSDEGIEIDGSEEQGTITIRDYGIGMTRKEITENLGTIARSGTKEFFQGLTGDQQKDSDLIGQFGVGFYSAFIVAKKVVVTSRKAGLELDEGIRWESDGVGEYSLETVRKKKRGTEIILY